MWLITPPPHVRTYVPVFLDFRVAEAGVQCLCISHAGFSKE